MPRFQHAEHVAQTQPARAQQHQQVIEQIGRLAQQFLVALGHGGQRGLHAFFADLLRDAPGAFVEQRGGIAVRRPFAFARGATNASRLPRKFAGACSKQLSRPRWHVGPRGWARISSVSTSQSDSMLTTSRK